ncbi:myb-like protein D [Anthonomus grandis grandis]|uniref:myb-like protein D n=1 Tax=Anthonomus grandis grandis TaxID=2921223 RepID=UPI0021658165|nr:myb-like protein D [Anthonomus grandis grandis]
MDINSIEGSEYILHTLQPAALPESCRGGGGGVIKLDLPCTLINDKVISWINNEVYHANPNINDEQKNTMEVENINLNDCYYDSNTSSLLTSGQSIPYNNNCNQVTDDVLEIGSNEEQTNLAITINEASGDIIPNRSEVNDVTSYNLNPVVVDDGLIINNGINTKRGSKPEKDLNIRNCTALSYTKESSNDDSQNVPPMLITEKFVANPDPNGLNNNETNEDRTTAITINGASGDIASISNNNALNNNDESREPAGNKKRKKTVIDFEARKTLKREKIAENHKVLPGCADNCKKKCSSAFDRRRREGINTQF